MKNPNKKSLYTKWDYTMFTKKKLLEPHQEDKLFMLGIKEKI